jgi:heavy metal efflux system protein
MQRLVDSALRRPALVIVLAACLAGYGLYAATQIPVDAFPDVTPTMVQVFTSSPGLAPEEIETLVSIPIESALSGMPDLVRVQSTSQFGLSVVNAYFEDGTDVYFARQLVGERLSGARTDIPAAIGQPAMGPITTGLGGVLMYRLVVDNESPQSLMEQRTVQDWLIKPMLRTTPGVTEVLSVGGFERQYQVAMDSAAMLARGVTIEDVRAALQANNRTVGAGVLERGGEETIVRGNGWIRPGKDGLRDIADTVVRATEGIPTRVGDVADVSFGPAFRSGAQVSNGIESVGGDVLKTIGANTASILPSLEEKLRAASTALPSQMHIEPYYSQASLVEHAVGTVRTALLEGSVLVLLVLFVFLGSIRSALIVIVILPLSVLASFIGMRWMNLSANLMSLGGLAIAIGMMVDGAVVMVENIDRRLASIGSDTDLDRQKVLGNAAREVAGPVAFAISIIIAVFLPLFTLEGVEGKMFAPMAYAISFALFASLLLATTLIPVLRDLIGHRRVGREPTLVAFLQGGYRVALDWVLDRPRAVVAAAVLSFIASLCLFPFLGTEFVPTLREGTYYIESALPPGASLDTTIAYTKRIQHALRTFPEVTGTYSRVGRTEVGGDPDPVNVTATTITLRPLDTWKGGRSYEQLQSDMAEQLRAELPEVVNNFSQPIQLRTDELITGVKAQVAISVYGDDLSELDRISTRIAELAERIDGAVDIAVPQRAQRSELLVTPDRSALSRFGMSVDDVLTTVGTGIGGTIEGQVYERSRRFDLSLRLRERDRNNEALLGALRLRTSDAAIVPLSRVANVSRQLGPAEITRNNGSRRAVVMLNVRNRDLGSVVADIRTAVQREIALPVGYWIEYGGQFENQWRAMQRLEIVVPIVLLLILLLLYFAFGRIRPAALIFMNIPFAVTGGVIALWLGGLYLSVPAAVGFIAVFGVAVLNGVVLVSAIETIRSEGIAPLEATRLGAVRRMRPVIMTALVTILGLIPLLLANGIGSEVQRPLAAVVVGGLLTSTMLTLFILPAVYAWTTGRVSFRRS